MEIFNIHLFEFLLIAGLALIVFGPERLPEFGRLIGKQVAKFLAWQQQSPELRLINEVRTDIEQEIASLRDELVRTRKQLDLSTEVSQIREEIRPLISLREPTVPVPAAVVTPELTPALNEAVVNEAQASLNEAVVNEAQASLNEAVVHEAQTLLQPDAGAAAAAALTPSPGPSGTVPAQRPERPVASTASGVLNTIDDTDAYLIERRALGNGVPLDQPPIPAPAPALNGHPSPPIPLSAQERDELVRQVQTLSADLQNLIVTLQQRGIIVEAELQALAPSEQESAAR
ncbi:MAG: Sec-independent protein translocase subunit TatA/TatB [Oscillochloridaceae bacterium umkhey_bin13]